MFTKNNFRCLVNKTSLHVRFNIQKNKPEGSFYKNLAKLLQFIKLVPALNNFFIDTTNYGFWSIFWTKNIRLQNLEK